jgi:hypothetical protein
MGHILDMHAMHREHGNQVTSINKRKTHLLGVFLVEQLKKDANKQYMTE